MAKQLQLRRGTTSQHSTFTGANGEVTIDTDKKVVVVHDGATAGGIPLAKQATVDTKVDKVTSTDNAIVRFNGTTGDVQNSGVTIDDNNQLILGSTDISSVWTNGSLGFHNTVGTTIRGKAGSVFDLSLYNAGGTSAILSHTPAGVVALSDGKLNIDSAGNVGIGTSDSTYGKLNVQGQVGMNCSGSDALSARGLQFFIDGTKHGNLSVDNYDNLLYVGKGIGYGTGAGGTVTQLTSKSTAVVLNKPTGTIITHNATMVSGAAVSFSVINTLVSNTDTVVPSTSTTSYAYTINCVGVANGSFIIRIVNNAASSLSENIAINFTIIKGANA